MQLARASRRLRILLYMITPEVVAFIKGQDAKGMSREAIRALLASQGGWSDANIDQAFNAVPLVYAAPTAETPRPPEPVAIEPEPKETSMVVRTIAAVFGTLFVIGMGAVAAYYFVPGVQEDLQLISSLMEAS